MQTRIAAIKNIRYGLSLKSTTASVPIALEAVAPATFPFGGVSGKIKLNRPRTAEAIARRIGIDEVAPKRLPPSEK